MTDDPAQSREATRTLGFLLEIALDLRWTWSHAGDDLWRALDLDR